MIASPVLVSCCLWCISEGVVRLGPALSVLGWVSCVVLIGPLRDCRGRQHMLAGVIHSVLNIPHVWNTMTTRARHNTHT